MEEKKEKSLKFSEAVTKKVIKLLREDGKMSVADIASAIGKSNKTVYKMAQGKSRLSAEAYGKLASSISSSLVVAIQNITMEDVKEVAGKAGELAKELCCKGSKAGTKLSRSAVKKVVKTTGRLLQAAGEFIKALGVGG